MNIPNCGHSGLFHFIDRKHDLIDRKCFETIESLGLILVFWFHSFFYCAIIFVVNEIYSDDGVPN